MATRARTHERDPLPAAPQQRVGVAPLPHPHLRQLQHQLHHVDESTPIAPHCL